MSQEMNSELITQTVSTTVAQDDLVSTTHELKELIQHQLNEISNELDQMEVSNTSVLSDI